MSVRVKIGSALSRAASWALGLLVFAVTAAPSSGGVRILSSPSQFEEGDAAEWRLRLTGPSLRAYLAMAYDSAPRVAVVRRCREGAKTGATAVTTSQVALKRAVSRTMALVAPSDNADRAKPPQFLTLSYPRFARRPTSLARPPFSG